VITQRFSIRDGVYCCAGCLVTLTDGELAHPGNCPELGQYIARAAEAIARRPYPPLPRPKQAKMSAS
jgi:hypothetical protein